MDKQRKGKSGLVSAFNLLRAKVVLYFAVRKGIHDYIKDYKPDERGVDFVSGQLFVPTVNGDTALTWIYERETLKSYDPRYYNGVFESAKHEQEYLEKRAFYSACGAALSMLEEANLCADNPEVCDIVMEAYDKIRECKSISEVHAIIDETQTKINKYRTVDPDNQFSGYNVPK